MRILFMSLLLSFVVQANGYASLLINSNTIRVHSPDGLTNVSDLRVQLSVLCRYKSGAFSPSKSCGERSQELKVENNSVIVPAISKFSGLRARNIDNYQVSISFYDNQQFLTSISARGNQAIGDLNRVKEQFNILRFEEGYIGVVIDGYNFFGSDYSKVDRASLRMFITVGERANLGSQLLIVNPADRSWSRENLESYVGKPLLSDAEVIHVPESSFGYFENQAPKEISVSFNYYQLENFSHKIIYKQNIKLPVKPSAFSSIVSIELE